jgi:hypothetical protein
LIIKIFLKEKTNFNLLPWQSKIYSIYGCLKIFQLPVPLNQMQIYNLRTLHQCIQKVCHIARKQHQLIFKKEIELPFIKIKFTLVNLKI